ncbi:YIP1 family protein [Bacillus sp. 1P10SD]|uniref:YIP1 family protein n=1 Tax=Bacillus sp. 1P10SD TaxID=3132265 RepID=UPI0039A637C5
MSTVNVSIISEKEIKFLRPFLFYILGLGCYLSTLLPYMNSLIPQKVSEDIILKIPHLDIYIAILAYFLLLFGVFFEGFILFLVGNLLGAKVNFRYFFKLFTFANIPMAIRLVVISIKNLFVDHPSTNLIFTEKNIYLSALNLFNISYLIILFLLLKYKTELNNTPLLLLFIAVAFIYRMMF